MEKKGIELIVDRIEALRVRIDRYRIDQYQRNSHSEVDYDHWLQLCRDALAETVRWQHAFDVITANLALPVKDTDPDTLAKAVQICVRRLEELETQPAPPDSPIASRLPDGSVFALGERRHSAWPPSKLSTLQDDEHRVDSIENAMLSAWLDDAQRRLRTSAAYMVAHEARFSEEMFDEMRLLADKINEWALSIKRGDRFP